MIAGGGDADIIRHGRRRLGQVREEEVREERGVEGPALDVVGRTEEAGGEA